MCIKNHKEEKMRINRFKRTSTRLILFVLSFILFVFYSSKTSDAFDNIEKIQVVSSTNLKNYADSNKLVVIKKEDTTLIGYHTLPSRQTRCDNFYIYSQNGVIIPIVDTSQDDAVNLNENPCYGYVVSGNNFEWNDSYENYNLNKNSGAKIAPYYIHIYRQGDRAEGLSTIENIVYIIACFSCWILLINLIYRFIKFIKRKMKKSSDIKLRKE